MNLSVQNLRPMLAFMFTVLALPAHAVIIPPPDLYLAAPCKPTPVIAPGKGGYPGAAHIIPSSKLVIPAGKSVLADGQLVTITGRVLDEKCVPVSDAVVEIWQADPRGQYNVVTNAQRANPYPAFAGSGRAITDNIGRFTFYTLFPGPYDHRAPHIHFRIAHKRFKPVFTEMFFAGDARNAGDPQLKHLKPEQQQLLMARIEPAPLGIQGYFDITLKGQNAYRKF